jgi:ferredoxin
VPTWLVVAVALFLAGAAARDMDHVRASTTYGNFDVPSDRAGIEAMAPGVPDLARLREYRFGPDAAVHATPLVALGVVFAVFLALRTWGGIESRLSIRRGFVQWGAFVLARVGVLRAANAAPVARCTFGVFPFLNCQYCEMASGACPVGVVQSSIVTGRFPYHAVAVVVGVGAMLGRWICGWFCPFGLFLDICGKGCRKGPVRMPHALRWGKFAMLGLLVAGAAGFALAGVDGVSWFCATICPAGSLYGLVPYYGTTAAVPFSAVVTGFDPSDGGHWLVVGHLVFFAAFLLVTFRVAARFFCSAMCPLGGALALFARVSAVRVVHEDSLCDGCGACVRVCPMGIDLGRDDWLTVSDCVQCTRCVRVCPTGARGWSFSRPVPAPRRAEGPAHVRV